MPISLYGASKLGSEALITAWAGTFTGAMHWIQVYQYCRTGGTRNCDFRLHP